MTTVLLYALAPINVRNMLRCGPLDELRARGARIVIVSPLAEAPGFRQEFEAEGVVVEHVPAYSHGRLQRRLDQLALERFVRLHPTTALRVRWERQENVATGRMRRFASAAKSLSGRVPLSPALILRALDASIPRSAYEEILRRHQPDAVCVASAWQTAELPWTVGARRFGIPSLAIDMNWDSFESKAGIIRGAERLLVWSEPLREKAFRRFGYASEAITITGAPQFDQYFDRRGVPERSAFLHALGFPADTRLITLATVLNTPQDPERLMLLLRWLDEGRLGPAARILVRLHPGDRLKRWERFQAHPAVRIERSFRDLPDGSAPLTGETQADMTHKLATLVHTDVLVNVNSTIAFEAMLVDLPTVMVAFDGQGVLLPYHQSDVRFLDYEHIQDLVAAGGVLVARTADELESGIARYLQGHHIDRELRARGAQRLYGWTDGGAAGRVAEAIFASAQRSAVDQGKEVGRAR